MPGGGLGGLGGMYGGFQQAESADLDIQKKRQGNQSDQLDMAGQQALGNALKLLSGQGGPPPGMPPGQSSQPQQPPMQGPPGGMQPQPPQGGPPMGPGAMPGGQRPMMPPMPQGAPQGGGQLPGMPPTGQPGMPQPGAPQQGGPPPMGGQQRPGGQQGPALDLQSAIAAVVKSNPGAPPIVITRAIQGLVPLMNAQAQMQWREMSLQLREQALMQQRQHQGVMEGQGQERIDDSRQRGGSGVQGGRGAGHTVAGQMMDKYFQEHPEATVEDYAKWVQSTKPVSATQLKLEGQGKKIDSFTTQIDSAIRDVTKSFKGAPSVTGVVGAANRAKEVLGNISGWTNETAAADFQTKIETLKVEVLRELAGTSRISNADREKADKIVRGIGMGATKQATISGLTYLKQVLQSLKPDGGNKQNGGDFDRAAAKKAGYSDEEIDSFLKGR